MKPINKLLESALKLRRSSRVLSTSFRRNSSVEIIESNKILKQRKKNQEERFKTFRSAIDAVKQKEQESGNKTNALLGGFGLSALVAGGVGAVRGRKPGMGARKPGTGAPRSSRVPTGGLRRPGALPKGRLPRVGGPLNAAFAGVDFAMRKGSGQTNLQAGVGAGAGLLGSLGGMKAGAAAGGAIGALFGGVGAIPGAAIGGLLGSFLGGSLGAGIADNITGADGRRKQETQRTTLLLTKSSFGRGLDSFESALNKLDGLNDLCNVPEEEETKAALGNEGEITPPPVSPAPPVSPIPPVSEPITSGRGEGREAFRPNREQEDIDLAKVFAIAGSVVAIAGIGAMVAEPGDPIGLSGALPALTRLFRFGRKLPNNMTGGPIKPQPLTPAAPTRAPKVFGPGTRPTVSTQRAADAQRLRMLKNKNQLRGDLNAQEIAKNVREMQNLPESLLRRLLKTKGDRLFRDEGGFGQSAVNEMRAFERVFKQRGLEIPKKLQKFLDRQNIGQPFNKINPPPRPLGPQSSTESSGSNTIAMIPIGEEQRQQQLAPPATGGSPTVVPVSIPSDEMLAAVNTIDLLREVTG